MISDDGAGVNAEAVYQKALSSGIVSEQENLTHNDKVNLIFHPGLSTASEISDISGRGVGMDVVKSEIVRLHGKISIDSRDQKGTTFTIKLQLTLAIIETGNFRIGPDRYGYFDFLIIYAALSIAMWEITNMISYKVEKSKV